MITFENSIAKIRVEAYSLYEFIQEIGEVMASRSTLCLENEYFCQNMGGNYLAYFDMSEELQDTIPEIVERREAERRANILDARDSRSDDDHAMSITSPTLEDNTPFTPEQDAALTQAPSVTPEQVENVNRRRGRQPRN